MNGFQERFAEWARVRPKDRPVPDLDGEALAGEVTALIRAAGRGLVPWQQHADFVQAAWARVMLRLGDYDAERAKASTWITLLARTEARELRRRMMAEYERMADNGWLDEVSLGAGGGDRGLAGAVFDGV